MSITFVVGIFIAIAGLVFCWSGLRRIRTRRLFSALQFEAVGVILLLLAALSILVSSNLVVYQRLVYEAPVATLQFQQKEPLVFDAVLTQVNNLGQRYEVHGDEWQLDARMLKWHGIANLLGLDAQYKLNRLAGRYTNIDQERIASRSVYAIGEKPAVDIWNLASEYDGWTNWLVDAAYGSAVYLPMTDGASYEITISQSGLVARPMNAAAKQAVSRWIGL
jgi:hypothetical protein